MFNNEKVLDAASEYDIRNEMKKVKNSKYDSIKKAINEEADKQSLLSLIAPRYRKFKKTELCRFITEKEVELLVN